MRLDDVDLDRYWRFVLPVALVGIVASTVLTVLVVAAREPPDAAGLLSFGLFLIAIPGCVGAVLTDRRRGRSGGADRSPLGWIGVSVLSAALFVAALQWREVWTGPDSEWLLAVVPAYIHGVAVGSALRYRRAVQVARASGPPASIPPPAPAYLPSGSGAPEDSPAQRGPWSSPTATDATAPSDRSGWPRLRWPGADPPQPWKSSHDGKGASAWRFLPPIVTAVAVTAFVATRQGTDTVVGDPDRPFYMGTVVAMDDPSLTDGVRHPEPPDPVLAAACRNYRDWLDDRSLDPDLVIVDDATLVRSAELLDGDYADDRVALEAETIIVQEGSILAAVRRMRAEDWPEADVEHATDYYRDRQDAPSDAAFARYVIYTTMRTTSAGVIARLAVDPERELMSKPMFTRILDITVQLTDGTIVRIDESLCWD